MKWALTLLGILTLPLLFNSPALEVLRLKTFDAVVETPNATGHFTILNITEEDLDNLGGYPLPRQDLARFIKTLWMQELMVLGGLCYSHMQIEWVGMMRLL